MPLANFPIHYDITLTSIAGHLFEVKLSILNPSIKGQILTLPSWIPGSYMIRDFAKHIVRLKAFTQDNLPLKAIKLDKQTWQIEPSKEPIFISYQIYAYDLSVRAAYINDQFGFFNGSNVFLELEGQSHQPCSLSITQQPFASSECKIATTMPLLTQAVSSSDNHHFQASNYAELIDHPVLIGKFDSQLFMVEGVEFELVLAGGHQSDMSRLVRDLTIICQQHFKLFADQSPIKRYLFITMLTDSAYGGLEHRSSTALMFARNDLPSFDEPESPSEGYRTFLSLCSHELLHTWHVKRIKPTELANGNLLSETYTEQLWIYEGFTSYYDDLFLQRAKVISVEDYLMIMGQNLTRLERNKGRLKQSVTESSFDAWTKFYKQDEGAINNIVSYYNKGAIITMCLDLSIRLASKHNLSLDDVMRRLWQQFGKTDVPTPKSVIHDILNELQLDLSVFLNSAIYSTDELPIKELLSKFGITVHQRARADNNDKGGENAQKVVKHDFGAQFKVKEIGVEIQQVSENSAAYNAGIIVGDIIIALGEWQVTPTTLLPLISKLQTYESVDVFVLRDKRLVKLQYTATPAPLDTLYLTIKDKTLTEKWLKK